MRPLAAILAVCAMAALTFPSNPAPPTKEILAHLGMALSYVRRAIVDRNFDESLLLAIIELVDFEVHTPLDQRD